MNVLIFEDSKKRIVFFENLMKKLGWDFCISDDYNYTIDKLSTVKYDYVFLDHDIENRTYTGYDVAKYIRKHDIDIKKIIVHSMNPYGAQKIANTLDEAVVCPFDVFYEENKHLLE